jgi:hypothetical protein
MGNIIIYENWIEPTKRMTEDQKREYFAILCMHRSGLPQRPEDAKDPIVQAVLDSILPLVDKAEKSKVENEERGKVGGRPSLVTDEEIHDFAMANPGMGAHEVADHFGVSYSKITHSKGWKERNKYWF